MCRWVESVRTLIAYSLPGVGIYGRTVNASVVTAALLSTAVPNGTKDQTKDQSKDHTVASRPIVPSRTPQNPPPDPIKRHKVPLPLVLPKPAVVSALGQDTHRKYAVKGEEGDEAYTKLFEKHARHPQEIIMLWRARRVIKLISFDTLRKYAVKGEEGDKACIKLFEKHVRHPQ